MDIKKLAPWNWFKKENEENGHTIPVNFRNKSGNRYFSGSFSGRQNEMDRFFDRLALSPFRFGSTIHEGITGATLKPSLDLGSTDQEYFVSIEIPGVSREDIHIELVGDALIVQGEKKQEKEEKLKNFYRLERFYGSFKRTLSLPEDANKENIRADFKKGILNISIPRVTLPENKTKKIEIKYA
jgi:HSP20 family protein